MENRIKCRRVLHPFVSAKIKKRPFRVFFILVETQGFARQKCLRGKRDDLIELTFIKSTYLSTP